MEKKEEKKEKQALNLEELDKVSGGLVMVAGAVGCEMVGAAVGCVFRCPECSKVFHLKKDANQHLKEVHGYKEDFFK